MPFLPSVAPPAPQIDSKASARVVQAAAALPTQPDWHGPFAATAPSLDLDLFGPGDVRPIWEANRLAALPLLAQAARLDPGGGHLARAEALLGAWCVANPPFLGPAWACAQEAALRALHLALALALLDADRDPPPGARGLLRLCARRIAATPHYGAAQDNNHALSEPAGAFACALLLDEREDAARHGRLIAARLARLVGPEGGFAQVSPGYTRLLLDSLALVEWLRRRHGLAPFPAPFAARAAAATAWLHRLTDPQTGATPRLGVEDGSALGDLSGAGPRDARASVERAARLFAETGADLPDDPGCAWLGLPRPSATLDRPTHWRAEGLLGWRRGRDCAVFRGGKLRFRPAQADLLHLTLMRDGVEILRDGGTGAYNPPAAWWGPALAGAAAHNGPVFDAAEPMPRAGRFLLARWPRMRAAGDGIALIDSRGNRATRRVGVVGTAWTITDTLGGPFRRVAWHWRLPDSAWVLGPEGATSPRATLRFAADAPFTLRLAPGFESPGYGAIAPATLLVLEATAPLTRLVTTVILPDPEPAA
jgi:hypothetical protein